MRTRLGFGHEKRFIKSSFAMSRFSKLEVLVALLGVLVVMPQCELADQKSETPNELSTGVLRTIMMMTCD